LRYFVDFLTFFDIFFLIFARQIELWGKCKIILCLFATIYRFKTK